MHAYAVILVKSTAFKFNLSLPNKNKLNLQQWISEAGNMLVILCG